MIPDEVLSSVPVVSDFLEPRDRPYARLSSPHYGGGTIGSGGQKDRVWVAYYEDGYIKLGDELGGTLINHVSVSDVRTISLAFDQNNYPVVFYMKDTGGFLYWHDPIPNAYVTIQFPGCSSGQVVMDDLRDQVAYLADVVLVYTREGTLYYRMHRERYTIERPLATDVKGLVTRIGMNRVFRLQIETTSLES